MTMDKRSDRSADEIGLSLHERALRKRRKDGYIPDAFLKIIAQSGPILGECTDSKHPNEIPVEAFEFDVHADVVREQLRGGQREYDVHPGGIAAEGLYFVTRVSKATIALWNQMMQGLPPMPKAILSCRRPGRQEEDFLIITMEQVDVARIKTMDTGEDDPTPICLVHLVFDLHRMDYREHKADGSASGKHAAGYDYKQHKAV